MSLMGRRIIDSLQKVISSRWLLPVPPYESSEYWDNIYKRFPSSTDCSFEWGDISYEKDLKDFTYTEPRSFREALHRIGFSNSRSLLQEQNLLRGSLLEATGLSSQDTFHTSKNILLLGCGNSRLGEDLAQHFIDIGSKNSTKDQAQQHSPKIIQCDVSPTVVDMMTRRYHNNLIAKGFMSIVKDDATNFSVLKPNSMDAIIDKGLIDALFCAKKCSHIHRVMSNVHQVLKQESSFIFFSFSRPEFILPEVQTNKVTETDTSSSSIIWKEVDIRLLNQIILYRFVKGSPKVTEIPSAIRTCHEGDKPLQNRKLFHIRKSRLKK